jgi:putative FmdB family regulatory protein
VPIYEYRCRNGHHFEVSQRMSDDPVSECQICGAPVERVLFAPAIHFKGTGFYNTDYGRRRAGKDGAEGATAGKDGAEGATAGKDGKDAKGGSDGGSGGEGAPKVKEATPKDTVARGTGP